MTKLNWESASTLWIVVREIIIFAGFAAAIVSLWLFAEAMGIG